MVRIFYKQGRFIQKETDLRELSHLENILWIDLQGATRDDEEWIETKCNVSFQTPQEIVEIESSARYFEQNSTINANSNFLQPDHNGYHLYPVSFMLRNNILFTYRTGDSKTFADTVRKMKVNAEMFSTGDDVFLTLLETRIESDADLLEGISREITVMSKKLNLEKKPNESYVLKISELLEYAMMVRESTIDKQRVMSAVLRSALFSDYHKERLRIILKDISSLLEYATFNFERLEYLQDTITGLINLEQNQIIKIFTVFTIVFLPPTLIAGIFGMNYQALPTSGKEWGFYFALLLMILSSAFILYFFRRKRWI
ncbi:magnesium/cobalt transporter CorA [Xanthocytophaga agilis]|uniref:Magnesium transport protein CorA n=1 Tax=Xanthocytophaga agilis TaxID=3048010 RepID=A0AAE3UHE7_9BACT|nr:magnesium/cobalt transporter CorA [Xanthocytophaga agilis]MDJ1505948.1 magnesium/cobalt transporter CorA [Xanthocytophaga agilis]